MTENLSPREIADCIGKSVLRAEHRHFVEASEDNRDHIPRATRIAGAVGAALRELGLSKHESASASASLLEFTKELFLDEWMSQIEEGEDSEVVLAEGKEEFGRCLVQPSA